MTVPLTPNVPWILLVFSLPTNQASRRVEVWRKLQKYGVLPLRSAGYVLPMSPSNQERFEWLAASIRKYKGQASVVHVQSIDNLPDDHLKREFTDARSAEYAAVAKELQALASKRNAMMVPPQLAKLRKRYQQIADVDFFPGPMRARVERLLMALSHREAMIPTVNQGGKDMKKEYTNRTWITRPRPGIDRASSAWLIRKFIDPKAKFIFATDATKHLKAVPFDMFGPGGFGHSGDHCTFETLCKEFRIRDAKVNRIAEVIHDADLDDNKFERSEGEGIDKVLKGWAHEAISDKELLERGINLIDGLYNAI